MRGRTIFMVLALVCVVVVVIVAVLGLNAPPPSTRVAEHPANSIAASGPIPVGTLIKPQDLTWVPKPADALSGTTFDRFWADNDADQGAADARSFNEVAGAVARRRIEKGDVITKSAIVKPGDSGFLAAVLKPGMRAITVAVTVVTGTAGLIYPGDHVDIILTQNFSGVTGPAMGKKTAGETIAEDVRVLAIDQQLQVKTDPNAGGSPGKVAATVTMEVTQDQAEHVAVAQGLGSLSLIIRSLDATAGAKPPAAPGAEEPRPPVWADDVSEALKTMAKAAEKAEPPPVPPQPRVLIVRGAQVEATGGNVVH